MLCLSRKHGGRIRLVTASGEVIWFQVWGRGSSVRVGIDADDSTEILREELIDLGKAATQDSRGKLLA